MSTTTSLTARPETDALRQHARELHRRAIVVDTHNDVVVRLLDLGHDLSVSRDDGFVDLPKMREGNFTAQFFACQIPTHHYAQGTAGTHIHVMLDAIRGFVAAHPEQLALARTADDIRALAAEGRQAVVLCIEGAHFIGDDFSLLERFAAEGIRYITPAHFFTSAWSDSSTDKEVHGGLSALGRRAVARMNELGIVVDVSHLSDKAFWQVLEIGRRPIIASHSCARSLVNHPRNLTDEMIAALGERDGLLGINFFPEPVSNTYFEPSAPGAAYAPAGRSMRRSRSPISWGARRGTRNRATTSSRASASPSPVCPNASTTSIISCGSPASTTCASAWTTAPSSSASGGSRTPQAPEPTLELLKRGIPTRTS